MNFPVISNNKLLKKLEHPQKKVHIVLDTDTYNEVDDQFALAYALSSPQNIFVEAVFSAPFHNKRSSGPADGMEKSYKEIKKILSFLNISSEGFVYKGSSNYLTKPEAPQSSDAARHLIKLAASCNSEELLYVVATGAITNIASAILMQPDIIKKIVIVWLGGHSFFWHDTREFNLRQDLYASRLIFDCGVPLIHIPCRGVASHLLTSVPELEYYLEGKSKLGSYLTQIVKSYSLDSYAWSKVIWDIAPVAWLINPEWITSSLVHSPILTDQITYSFDNRRHFIRSANFVNRDRVFADLFKKLCLLPKD